MVSKSETISLRSESLSRQWTRAGDMFCLAQKKVTIRLLKLDSKLSLCSSHHRKQQHIAVAVNCLR